MTALRAGLVGMAAVLGLAAPQAALAAGPDLPPITPDQLAGSVHDLDLAVSDIVVDGTISDLERDSGTSGSVVLDADILFAFGEATISDEAANRLAELVDEAPDGASVEVVGHTDSVGSDADNQALSVRRAKAVAAVLEGDRPDLEVTATGRGESDPVEPNERGGEDNPEGREKNRRVEITVGR